MADPEWNATVNRVRAEFQEMPEMHVTCLQAEVLFGLSAAASEWVLRQLALEGFLDCADNGEYSRRDARP